jgi:hypothetical protein
MALPSPISCSISATFNVYAASCVRSHARPVGGPFCVRRLQLFLIFADTDAKLSLNEPATIASAASDSHQTGCAVCTAACADASSTRVTGQHDGLQTSI